MRQGRAGKSEKWEQARVCEQGNEEASWEMERTQAGASMQTGRPHFPTPKGSSHLRSSSQWGPWAEQADRTIHTSPFTLPHT